MSMLGLKRSRDRGGEANVERPIVILVGGLLLFESSLYSVVTPLLPHYAHVLHASKPAVGILAGCYAAGMLPGALLGGWLAARAGVRRTTLLGLLLFAVSVSTFGFAARIGVLDGLRLLQGIACGVVWGGGLTWVIAVTPRERRGQALGAAIGAAIVGTVAGPVIGTLAVALSTEVVFSLVAMVTLGLAIWTAGHDEPPKPEPTGRTPWRALRDRKVVLGSSLIVLSAATIGALSTLVPLRLAHFGASGIVIGATFMLSSVLSAFTATPIGRLVDRRGPALPLSAGLIGSALVLVVLPLPQAILPLAFLTVLAVGPPLTSCTIPAMTVLTDASEQAGLALAVGTMVLNLSWALGEMIGAPASAGLSQATSDAVPIALLACLMGAMAVVVRRTPLAISSGEVGAGIESPGVRDLAGLRDGALVPERVGARID